MTARELIDLLSALPPETLILVSGYEAGLNLPDTPYLSTEVKPLMEYGEPVKRSRLNGTHVINEGDCWGEDMGEPMTAFVIPRP